nr:hypothetical protein Iba_chr12cCG14710 [Ipomoea batatas]
MCISERQNERTAAVDLLCTDAAFDCEESLEKTAGMQYVYVLDFSSAFKFTEIDYVTKVPCFDFIRAALIIEFNQISITGLLADIQTNAAFRSVGFGGKFRIEFCITTGNSMAA